MKYLMVILFVVAAASGARFGARVWGGENTTSGQFPFVVALNDPRQFCDGTIISPNWILTAAHCLYELSPEAQVFIGSHINHVGVGGTSYSIIEAIEHEEYGEFNAKNDIALIKINGTLEYSDTVQPIEFGDPPDINSTCVVVGWGATETEDFPELLRFSEVTAIDMDLCTTLASDLLEGYYLGPEQMCSLAPEGISPCYGDSGGPLICDGKLAGIVSYSLTFDCGTGLPDVYIRPVAYADWIQEHMLD